MSLIRKKIVRLDGAEAIVAPLTFNQYRELSKPIEPAAPARSLKPSDEGYPENLAAWQARTFAIQTWNAMVVATGLNNASCDLEQCPACSAKSEFGSAILTWTPEKIMDTFDPLFVGKLRDEVLTLTDGQQRPLPKVVEQPGEETAAK